MEKKRKIIKKILIAFSISIGLFGILCIGMFYLVGKYLCGNYSQKTLVSPDGNNKAILFHSACMLTSMTPYVVINNIDDDLFSRKRIVFRGNENDFSVDFEWITPDTLLIFYDPIPHYFEHPSKIIMNASYENFRIIFEAIDD